ncbi:hypothetical protein QO010_002734 [Caulobacter ginsengisoli]|uniref:SPOR domain-containing protein n=1 Tax=Caulobacter ginsengisoli TaxID=400775 RepID=A0ABU0ISG5_9CAUL|nr:hypothetical protein [Caulobacter ginsengisoli]MDQ0464950.1 hypothetical protein [Caulobacter ginsengisoli]
MSAVDLAAHAEALGRRSRLTGAVTLLGGALMFGAIGASAWGVYSLQTETRRLEAQKARLKADIDALTRTKSTLQSELATSQDSLAKAATALQAGDVPRAQQAIDTGQAAAPPAGVARVFFQLRSDDQVPLYRSCGAVLARAGYRVPNYEMLPNAGPRRSEIRYYHKAEAARAAALARILGSCGAGPMTPVYIRRFENSGRVKPLVFEAWLAPGATPPAEPGPQRPVQQQLAPQRPIQQGPPVQQGPPIQQQQIDAAAPVQSRR